MSLAKLLMKHALFRKTTLLCTTNRGIKLILTSIPCAVRIATAMYPHAPESFTCTTATLKKNYRNHKPPSRQKKKDDGNANQPSDAPQNIPRKKLMQRKKKPATADPPPTPGEEAGI